MAEDNIPPPLYTNNNFNYVSEPKLSASQKFSVWLSKNGKTYADHYGREAVYGLIKVLRFIGDLFMEAIGKK